MKFTEAAPNENYPVTRLISESGVWELGIVPTLFGFRVCANLVGDDGYLLSYCCGDNRGLLMGCFVAVMTALATFDEQVTRGDVHRAFPLQTVKPLMNDPECWAALLEVVNPVNAHSSR